MARSLQPCGQFATLLAVAFALGLAAQAFSPRRIPWTADWSAHVQTKALRAGLALATTDEARAFVESGAALLLDARVPADYEAGRLPGALSFPIEDRATAYATFAELFTPEQRLLVYCSGQTCEESLQLSLFLLEQGHTNQVLYVDGFKAWQQAGLPVEK